MHRATFTSNARKMLLRPILENGTIRTAIKNRNQKRCDSRRTDPPNSHVWALSHKGRGGCKSWITVETTTVALFSSLKSMQSTSSKHRTRPPSAIRSSCISIGVSKLCSFAYRKAHFLIDFGHSRQLLWSWAWPHAVLGADGVVVGSTLPMLNALPVLRDRRAAAPGRFRPISV